MTQPRTPRSPQSAALSTIRRDGWTIERQTAFLEALAAGASVAGAAQQVGMSRQAAYALRARLKGQPFDQAWQIAASCRLDELLDAALDRAVNGIEVPHFHDGRVIHISRRYDERLTVALLRARQTAKGKGVVSQGHPAGRYGGDDFAALLDRVAEGPDTWEAQIEEEYAAVLVHEAALDAAEAARKEAQANGDYDDDDDDLLG